jgi:hypothetical protein
MPQNFKEIANFIWSVAGERLIEYKQSQVTAAATRRIDVRGEK